MGDGAFPSLRFWPTSVRILCGGLAMSLDALLDHGVRNGEHAVYEIRERIVLCALHGRIVSSVL